MATSTSKRNQTVMIVVAFVLVAGLAAVIALATASENENSSSLTDLAEASIDGEPLPTFGGDPASDAAIGQAAPAFEGVNFAGEPVSFDPAQEGPAAVVFLAHWCPHCQEELPAVSQWLQENELPEGVDVIAVAAGNDPTRANYPPDTWFEREGWTEPVVYDGSEGNIAQGYGLSAFPYWVFVDGDGNVVQRLSGRIQIDQFEQMVESLATS